MRNIDEYTTKYAIPGFEDYQVKYRRKLVLEQIERYSPSNILEIGCMQFEEFVMIKQLCM